MLIKIKTSHFRSWINHQEHLFLRKLITSYFRPVNIAKFLTTAFYRTPRLQTFLKIDVLKSVTNFTGKRFCWSLFSKNLQVEVPQLYLKKNPTRVFFSVVCKIFKRTFILQSISGRCFCIF